MRENLSALILMACFNGEKYISEQIDSILDQTFKNWKLIVRDDGSNDKTLDIIKHYCELDSRICFLQNDTDRHGAYLNFFTLIDYAQKMDDTYDYYFFADQDDIWFEDKLEQMIRFAEDNGSNKIPMLVYGDMQVIGQDGELIYPSVNQVMGIGEMSGMSLFFIHAFLWGCDILINHKLFALTPCFPLDREIIQIMSHDNYYGKFALILGEVLYFPQPCIQHRRHGENETGSYNFKLGLRKGIKRVVLEWQDLSKAHARIYNQSLQTISVMHDVGITDIRLDDIESAIVHGGFRAARILHRFGVKRKQRYRMIGVYLILLLKSYKKYILLPNE